MSYDSKFDAAGRLRPEHMGAIERMRDTVKLLNNCGEDFAQRFTEKQLVTLWLAYRACGWDLAPDEWTEFQILMAFKGHVPNWDNKTGEPIASEAMFKVLR